MIEAKWLHNCVLYLPLEANVLDYSISKNNGVPNGAPFVFDAAGVCASCWASTDNQWINSDITPIESGDFTFICWIKIPFTAFTQETGLKSLFINGDLASGWGIAIDFKIGYGMDRFGHDDYGSYPEIVYWSANQPKNRHIYTGASITIINDWVKLAVRRKGSMLNVNIDDKNIVDIPVAFSHKSSSNGGYSVMGVNGIGCRSFISRLEDVILSDAWLTDSQIAIPNGRWFTKLLNLGRKKAERFNFIAPVKEYRLAEETNSFVDRYTPNKIMDTLQFDSYINKKQAVDLPTKVEFVKKKMGLDLPSLEEWARRKFIIDVMLSEYNHHMYKVKNEMIMQNISAITLPLLQIKDTTVSEKIFIKSFDETISTNNIAYMDIISQSSNTFLTSQQIKEHYLHTALLSMPILDKGRSMLSVGYDFITNLGTATPLDLTIKQHLPSYTFAGNDRSLKVLDKSILSLNAKYALASGEYAPVHMPVIDSSNNASTLELKTIEIIKSVEHVNMITIINDHAAQLLDYNISTNINSAQTIDMNVQVQHRSAIGITLDLQASLKSQNLISPTIIQHLLSSGAIDAILSHSFLKASAIDRVMIGKSSAAHEVDIKFIPEAMNYVGQDISIVLKTQNSAQIDVPVVTTSDNKMGVKFTLDEQSNNYMPIDMAFENSTTGMREANITFDEYNTGTKEVPIIFDDHIKNPPTSKITVEDNLAKMERVTTPNIDDFIIPKRYVTTHQLMRDRVIDMGNAHQPIMEKAKINTMSKFGIPMVDKAETWKARNNISLTDKRVINLQSSDPLKFLDDTKNRVLSTMAILDRKTNGTPLLPKAYEFHDIITINRALTSTKAMYDLVTKSVNTALINTFSTSEYLQVKNLEIEFKSMIKATTTLFQKSMIDTRNNSSNQMKEKAFHVDTLIKNKSGEKSFAEIVSTHKLDAHFNFKEDSAPRKNNKFLSLIEFEDVINRHRHAVKKQWKKYKHHGKNDRPPPIDKFKPVTKRLLVTCPPWRKAPTQFKILNCYIRSGGGYINLLGKTIHNGGSTVAIHISPQYGTEVIKILIDGKPYTGIKNIITMKNFNANHIVEIFFTVR